MTRKKLSWFLLVLVYWLGGASHAQEYTQTYSDDLYQFHISLPNTQWNFFDLSQGDDPVKVKINYYQAMDQYVPNITLSISEVDPSLSFDCIIEKTLAAYAGKLELSKQKQYKLGGRPVADLSLAAPKLSLLFLQRLILKDKRLYVITYSAKSASFDRFVSDAKKIFDSLIFINKDQKSL